MEEEILKTRWKDVDKLLAKYSKDYKKLNKKTQDKLQDVFNLIKVPYQDLNKPISKQEKARLDRFILELQESGLLSDYFGYRARLILNKKKVTYNEMLRIMIEGCYIQENKELDEINNLLYYEIADNAYTQGIKEAGILKPIHFHIPFETMYLLLNIPLLEATAEAYLMALEMNNAEELYKRALMILQQDKGVNVYSRELQELFKKQQRSIINIREEGQPTGAISNITDNLVNEAYLQVAKDNGIQKVRFIAEMDERTTRMCKNMNGMIFNVQAENKFKRYFGYDAKHLYYKTITCYGLVKGLNMPPIDNHFHWCRSTLTYQLDMHTKSDLGEKKYKIITQKWLSETGTGKEPVIYKIGDDFYYEGSKYTIDGNDIELSKFKPKEKEFYNWIKNNIDKDIIVNPKFNKPESIKCSDLYLNYEKYDMKVVSGKSYQLLYHNIYDKEKQAHAFLFETTNSPLNIAELIEQVDSIFSRNDTSWVEKIGIKKGEQFYMFQRK